MHLYKTRSRYAALQKLSLLALIYIAPLQGEHHENTFPIEEESLAQVIQDKLQAIPDEVLKEKQEAWKKALLKRLQSPSPVQGISKATEYRCTIFDPSITVNQDITDLYGNQIAEKGMVINPLEKTSLSSGLLLFDGTRPEHIAWAKSQEGEFKWILVNGSPLELENQEGRPVFFDQGGFICRKFEIANVPCRILQQGKRLMIEEMPIEGR